MCKVTKDWPYEKYVKLKNSKVYLKFKITPSSFVFHYREILLNKIPQFYNFFLS